MKYEAITEGEVISLRKDFISDNGVMSKGQPLTPDVVRAPKFDPAIREARFVMSAEVPDRMGDIVVQEGLDLTNFSANPQALLFHNSRDWPIGTWKDVAKVTGKPRRTEGTLKFLDEGVEPNADRAFGHVKAGTMRTVSIGFRPDYKSAEAIKDDDGRFMGIRWNKGDLLECSLVPIPALPVAAMKELKAGMLSPEVIDLIKGICESYVVDESGKVVDKDLMQGALLMAAGNKTYSIPAALTELVTSAKDTDVVETRDAAGALQSVTITAKGEPAPKPKDGEETPVAPNPAEKEVTKSAEDLAAALADMKKAFPADAVFEFAADKTIATIKLGDTVLYQAPVEVSAKDLETTPLSAIDPAIADDIVKQIRDDARAKGVIDSLGTRILRALLPLTSKAAPVEPPAPVPADPARQAALKAQMEDLQTKSVELLG